MSDAETIKCPTCGGTGCTHDGCPDYCGTCPTCRGNRRVPAVTEQEKRDAQADSDAWRTGNY